MKLFMSYPHKDLAKTKKLILALERGGQDVWFDDALRAGQQWRDALRQAIEECDGIVLALTPNWINSAVCQWEFITAVEMDKKVFPVLLDPTPNLPGRISRYQYVDFTAGVENQPDKIQKFMDDLAEVEVKVPAKTTDQEDKTGFEQTVNQEQNSGVSGSMNANSGTINYQPGNSGTITSQSGNSGTIVTGNNNTLAGRDVNQNKTSIRIGGNVSGGMVNIGGNQTVHGNININMRDLTNTIQRGNAAPTDKEKLAQLVAEMKAELQSVPESSKKVTEKVAQRTEQLVEEISAEEVDVESVSSKSNDLQRAAENIEGVLPRVFGITTKIIGHVANMVRIANGG